MMVERKTISQVSKGFQVSTRTLRYYEQKGLIHSGRTDGYAYRTYDELSLRRLQLIILLRELRIPLKDIKRILDHGDSDVALDVFRQVLSELDDEITALSTIKALVKAFFERLQILPTNETLRSILLSDESLLAIIDSLSSTTINFEEEKTMDDLSKAVENQSKLTDVRIVQLPPFTVAASHFVGDNPEENAGSRLCEYLKSSDLYRIKPDARVFGFNHPNPSQNRPHYGYETWVTIPKDMEVSEPLETKHFAGGFYAAHMIVLGNFHEWEWLVTWVTDNPKYEANYLDDDGECMNGCLEEHLNFVYHAHLGWPDSDEHQLDLLLPIKLK